jgi:hypothetical protein
VTQRQAKTAATATAEVYSGSGAGMLDRERIIATPGFNPLAGSPCDGPHITPPHEINSVYG